MPSLGVAAITALSLSKSFFYLLVCVHSIDFCSIDIVINFCKNGTFVKMEQ